jgi:hypothetical protein
VFCYSLAYCRAVCFSALVKVLVESILGIDKWFFLGIVLIYFGAFSVSLVSATSSNADDIAHT